MSFITEKGATGALALQASGTFQSSTDPNLATLVGARWDLSDGREVILVSNGATAIATAGLLCQDAAIVANHQGLVVTTVTAYSANGNVPASAAVTLGATQIFAGQYAGGLAVIDSGPGIGQTLRIASNPGAASSATNVTLVFEDGPNTALTTSSTICLLPPHGANIVVNPTTPTGAIVGATLYNLAAGQVAGGTTGTPTYAFLVTKGIVSLLSDATVATVGQAIGPSVGTVGASTLATTILATGSAGTVTTAVIGYAAQTAVSAKARAVFLNV